VKRMLSCLLQAVLLFAFLGTAGAQERKPPDPNGVDMVVLDKGTFVEVRDRGPRHHSVILYEIVKGKIRVVDAVRVNSDFTKDPPVIRYTRISDIKQQ